MRSAFLILFTVLNSISATLTESSDYPAPSLQLRSPPAVHRPVLGVANKVDHVPIRRSGDPLPKHHALRSVLGLDQDHIGRRQNGESVPSVQLTGQSYIADVTIGEQEIPVLIDTGSADLWVAPESFVCLDENHNEVSQETCNIPVYFKGNFSGGLVEDEYFSISYANGQYVYGEYGYEAVTLGGITVDKQQIALPSTGYFQATSGDFSGIMGLGFPAMTAARSGGKPQEAEENGDSFASYDPWFTSAAKQHLTQPVFSLALDIHGGGVLALGGAADVPIKGEYVSTPIIMLNLNQEDRASEDFTYYTIMAEDYIVAGQSFVNLTTRDAGSSNETSSDEEQGQGKGFPVIVDSGYSTNILPPSLIKALYGAFETPPELVEIQGATLFAAPCDAEVPSFGIQIGGHVFEQSAQEVLISNANATVNGTSYCILGSQPGIEQAGALGVTFLSSVVAVFDIGASEMRFAQREGDSHAAVDGGSPTHGNSSFGNSSTGGNSPGGSSGGSSSGSGGIVIPPASSGLASTNAGPRLLPLENGDSCSKDRCGHRRLIRPDAFILGFELVKQLLAKPEPYRFILGARDTERTKKAYDDLKFDSTTHSLTVLPLELSNLKTVKSFAQQTLEKLGRDRLDYLLLNAGMAKGAIGPGLHGSKWCEAYVVNHLSQHYLTHLFRDKLVESKSRVVVVSSGAIRRVSDTGVLDTQLLADSGTEDQTIYPDSKFVQLLGAHWWRRQLPECRVVAVSPGLIPQTGIARHGSMKLTMDMPDAKTVPEGAQSILRAFTRDDFPADPEQIFLTSWGEWWGKDVYEKSLDKALQDKWCPSQEAIEREEGIDA